MKKILSLIISIMLCLSMLAGCSTGGTTGDNAAENTAETTADASTENTDDSSKKPQETSPVKINVASLKGPTTIGMSKLIEDSKSGEALNDYDFNMYGTADEIVPKLVNNEIDIALVPCNLASVLYNKTEGAVQVAGINTLGVLYILENGDSIQRLVDLKGKTIYSTGKGTTPEYSLNYILEQNGIVPGTDVKIEFKSEATEIAALMSESDEIIAVLPQPFATVVQAKNPDVRIAIDFTEEWEKIDAEGTLVTGVVIARKAFIEENPEAFQVFLGEYGASTQYVNENVEEAAGWIAEYGIVPNAEVGAKAIPKCNITFIKGDEMQTKISNYLKVLFEANPQSVGGSLPEDDFYYKG
jgi:NitT/TauT family transport system substrate-binding protein